MRSLFTAPTRLRCFFAVLPLVAGGCSWVDASHRALTLGDLPALLLGGALLNALVILALIVLWERTTRRSRLCRPLEQEIRLLRYLTTPEGLARKTALLRELNGLGSPPSELDDTVLTGADLRGMNLSGCRMRSVRLDHADLQGAVLSRCDLFGADFSHANLAMADLSHADLRSADLDSAQLIKADLTGTRLRRANLINADLNGVDLSKARIAHARFGSDAQAALPRSVHPSVEDWVRARLDPDGRFDPKADIPPFPPEVLPDAS